MSKLATITKTQTTPVRSDAIQSVALAVSPTPEVVAQIRDILTNETSQAHVELVTFLAERYLAMLEGLREHANKGDWRAVQTSQSLMKDFIELLGLKATTKTTSGTMSIDLSDYKDLGSG